MPQAAATADAAPSLGSSRSMKSGNGFRNSKSKIQHGFELPPRIQSSRQPISPAASRTAGRMECLAGRVEMPCLQLLSPSSDAQLTRLGQNLPSLLLGACGRLQSDLVLVRASCRSRHAHPTWEPLNHCRFFGDISLAGLVAG